MLLSRSERSLCLVRSVPVLNKITVMWEPASLTHVRQAGGTKYLWGSFNCTWGSYLDVKVSELLSEEARIIQKSSSEIHIQK